MPTDHDTTVTEYISTMREISGEEALAVLDELRSMLTKWEQRMTSNAAHYDQAGAGIADTPAGRALELASVRALARRDVVRDVLSVIGR